jgi:hypothetical protein
MEASNGGDFDDKPGKFNGILRYKNDWETVAEVVGAPRFELGTPSLRI